VKVRRVMGKGDPAIKGQSEVKKGGTHAIVMFTSHCTLALVF
jgi:hypothetical protein